MKKTGLEPRQPGIASRVTHEWRRDVTEASQDLLQGPVVRYYTNLFKDLIEKK